MLSYEEREPLVELNDITLQLGGKQILGGVSRVVKNIVRPGLSQGQVVGIVGASGAGKTQLSRILVGLQTPTSGSVTVGGRATRAGDVGYVQQSYPLLPHRTVLSNLSLAARVAGAGGDVAIDKAMAYLAMFELTEKANEYPRNLSGGQRQRVAIAQQLLCSGRYVVMDEPFTGLDPLMKDMTCDLIRRVAQTHEEMTIFVVAHDLQATIEVADRVWLLGRSDPSVGSTIQREWNLAAMGMAWQPGVSATHRGQELMLEMKETMRTCHR